MFIFVIFFPGIFNSNITGIFFYKVTVSSAAEVPVKFQSDWTILTANLAASRLHEILQIRCLIGYWNRAQVTRHYLSLCINSCNAYNTMHQWVKPILSLMLFSFQLQCFVHVHTCICNFCILNWSLSIKVWFHEKTFDFLFWSILKSALNKNNSMTDENRLADHYEKIGWALLVRIDWAVLMRIEWEL